MDRIEVLESYAVDSHGIIRSPGKFEGCMLYVPALWDAILNGEGEGDDGSEDIPSERIQVTAEDIEQFPELAGIASCVLWETDQGFVLCAEEDASTAVSHGIEVQS